MGHTRKTLTTTAGLCCATLLIASCSASRVGEVRLLGDTIAGQGLTVVEQHGTPTIWMSSDDNSDPRPGSKPDPSLCSISGGGPAEIVAPENEGTATLGETSLYPLAQINNLDPPATITCDGAGFKQMYVGTLG